MKFIRPFYYDDFTCIGGKCKDTCCRGWNIIIDKDSCENYQQVKGEFGEKLNKAIVYGDTVKFALDVNGVCPLLNNEQLCEVFINLGEDKMCNVCKTYPRMLRKIHDTIESDLTLSCPEVARVLVEYKEPLDFLFGDDENAYVVGVDSDKINLFNALIAGRGLSVDIMQMDNIPFWKRLYMCISIADKIQYQILKEEVVKVKEIIETFRREEYILTLANSLSGVEKNFSLKLAHYNSVISMILNLKMSNQKFLDFLIESAEFINGNEDVEFEEKFKNLSNDFDMFIKENRAFENYIVYYLFHYYMEAYNDEDIRKYIIVMVEAYALMKLFAMVRWYNNGLQLSEEEFIDIFYSYSRFIEHGADTMAELFDQNEKDGYDNLAYLVALIR